MQAVRQTQGTDNSTGNLIVSAAFGCWRFFFLFGTCVSLTLFLWLQIQKEEKLQRTRDLKTIQLYR